MQHNQIQFYWSSEQKRLLLSNKYDGMLKESCGNGFVSGVVCAEGMGCGRKKGYTGTSGNRGSQFTPQCVVKEFTVDVLTISPGSLF